VADLYDRIGDGYAATRVADARIAALIDAALGDSVEVVNVGAGTGNYEPVGRRVTAVEPSEAMIAQRRPDAAVAVRAYAEALPFPDRSFDAAMAVWTLHHWSDWRAGVREMRRVSRGRIVIATWDPTFDDSFWFTREYLPEAAELDTATFPRLPQLLGELGGGDVATIPVPNDCTDGFTAAYWARPERLLEPTVQANISIFARIPAAGVERALAALRRDLDTGEWGRRHGHLRRLPALDLGYRLVTAVTV
jgi:SAM-dependent methyltransferase